MRRLGALAVVSLLALASPWKADAQEPVDVVVTEIGWWSSRPGATAQPEGGFEVAAGPTGEAQSVAALRLSIAATKVDSLQVYLAESSSLGTELGVLRLCAATTPWVAANPGSLDDAPEADCSISAGLTRTTDGVWLGDAAALAPQGGVVTLLVVPVYQPPVPIGPGMVVTIGGGELTAVGSSPAPTTQQSSPIGDGTSTFDPGASAFYGPSIGGSFGVPTYAGAADFGTVPTSIVPSTDPADADESGDDDDDFALTPIHLEADPPPPWIRLVVLVPLCVGFGVGSVRIRRALIGRLLASA